MLCFIAAIGPLVFVHELGHYWVGRWFGVKADAFSIGFGREMFGWTDKRGTRWKIGWMPLGGYVRFAGDMSPASEPSDEWKALPLHERNKTFQSKALWQRALIVLAGPVTNLLVAVLILGAFLMAYGQARTPPLVQVVQPGSAAETAGFKAGDRIESLGGARIRYFEEIYEIVQDNARMPLEAELMRGGQSMKLTVTPTAIRERDRFGNEYRIGRIGIGPPKRVVERVPLADVPGMAIGETYSLMRRMVDGVAQIITGRRAIDELGGPLKIAQMSGQIATLGWESFVYFVALISINLGFINLLPVPMLDGGHLTFYALEAIRRKPVSARAQEWAFRSGLVVMVSLMLFITFHNDFKSVGIWDRLAGLIG
jgi:regulator of sigma E protease